MSNKPEIRAIVQGLDIETRSEEDKQSNILVGYAAVFDKRTSLGYLSLIHI